MRYLNGLAICFIAVLATGCWSTVTVFGSAGAGKDALEVHKTALGRDEAKQAMGTCKDVVLVVFDDQNTDTSKFVAAMSRNPWGYAKGTMLESEGHSARIPVKSKDIKLIIYGGQRYEEPAIQPNVNEQGEQIACEFIWEVPQG